MVNKLPSPDLLHRLLRKGPWRESINPLAREQRPTSRTRRAIRSAVPSAANRPFLAAWLLPLSAPSETTHGSGSTAARYTLWRYATARRLLVALRPCLPGRDVLGVRAG